MDPKMKNWEISRGVLILDDRPTVFFDCDDTLVMWVCNDPHKEGDIYLDGLHLRPHKRHIELMKYHVSRGRPIVVWSQGGSEWAHDIIKALDLEHYVNIIMRKPEWAYDDKPTDEWINRKYIEFKDE